MKTGDLIRPFDFDGDYVYEYRSTIYDGEHENKKYFRYLCIAPSGATVSFPTDNEFWFLGHKEPTDISEFTKAKTIWEILKDREKNPTYGPHPKSDHIVRHHYTGEPANVMQEEPKTRWEESREAGLPEPWVNEEDDAKATKAEVIVNQYLGSEHVAKKKGVDPGWDLVHRGWLIDVKWCESPKRKLMVKEWMPRKADIYVLVIDERPVGWTWRDRIEAAPIKVYGKSDQRHKSQPVFVMDRDELRPMQQLLLLTGKDMID